MERLMAAEFNRAREFLLSEARPLERAIFVHAFDGGIIDQVLAQLEGFQNRDGGFGQALEPDVRTPTSSALCTEMGLRYLVEWEIPAEHSLVKAVVKYLLDTFDEDTQVWRVLPTDANNYPHAPWWHDEDGSLARTFDNFLVIPRAGILGSLYHYTELVPAEWLGEVTARTVSDIMNLETERFGGGGDTLVYALRLADAPGLPRHFKSSLEPFLRQVADAIVTRDPEAWSGYSTPPLKLVPTPNAPLADMLIDDVQIYLDYLINQQSKDGAWEPTWNWGDFYPKSWEQALQEWRGILTLDTLRSLQVFSRLLP